MPQDPFGNPIPTRLVSRMRPIARSRSGSGERGENFQRPAVIMGDGGPLLEGDGLILSIVNTGSAIQTQLALAQGPDRDVIFSDNMTPGKTVGVQIKFRNGLYVMSVPAPQIKLTGVFL